MYRKKEQRVQQELLLYICVDLTVGLIHSLSGCKVCAEQRAKYKEKEPPRL